ncbi:unnamed protein product [Acanthoscelides obtectus]|uniref:Uncharacterized protein n=1 Tax=Acanthoscelides obtectus TaxID=200917 RepID=A0A9P0Q8T3_ACAOB|nr:unnamed protein product [Acanthoscelides obtectus]CAK1652382.1 hypothetical protein AOBTE_LOCUS17811 [Acanthoscelides obtectus]
MTYVTLKERNKLFKGTENIRTLSQHPFSSSQLQSLAQYPWNQILAHLLVGQLCLGSSAGPGILVGSCRQTVLPP